MNDIAQSSHRRRVVSYAQARLMLVCGGLLLLTVTAAVSYVRRVETPEVVAILLFMPIFLAFVAWDWMGGLAAAAGATAVYVAIRIPAIHAVGMAHFSGVIASRTLAFFAFGAIGGLANRQVRASLVKLDLYDEVDDVTGLSNARSLLQTIDLEMSRSKRYQSIFSLSVVNIPTSTFAGVSRRRRRRALRDIAAGLRASVRTVDKVAHGADIDRHLFAVVLPETGGEGARIFTQRLTTRLRSLLGANGITSAAITFPGDEASLQRVRNEFIDIDRAEHPEHPTPIAIISAA